VNPLISIIIPFKNCEDTIACCLESVSRLAYDNFEVILLDNDSIDRSKEIALERGFHAIPCSGPIPAVRNEGARRARGEKLFFTDSDVCLPPDILSRMTQELEKGNCDVIVGTYSEQHPHENLASQYKNLWIRYSYTRLIPSIDFIFTAVSAIRREVFLSAGGFAGGFSHKTGGTDIDMGMRLRAEGFRIKLDTSLDVIHLKRYSFLRLLKNDFFRSIGYSRLAAKKQVFLQSVQKGFSNIYPRFIWSVVLSMICLFNIFAALLWSSTACLLFILLLTVYLYLNRSFLSYYAHCRSYWEAAKIVPIIFADHAVCGFGSVIGVCQGLWNRKLSS